jgi:hypothetical protein
MSNLSSILKILDEIIRLEKKAEEAIASEKDKSRRDKIAKAFKERNGSAIRDILFKP